MSGPSWSTVNPGLIQIFSDLALPDSGGAQAPAWSPEWKDRKVTATAVTGPLKGVKLYLKVTSVVGIGDDDRRLSAGATGSTYAGMLEEDIYGLRRVTLNLQTTCTEVSDDQWAVSILERIRTRLRRRRVIDALLVLDIGIVRIMQAVDLSRAQDQKVQSRASMDVILTMLSSDQDPIPTGWFNTIVYSSHISDVNGVELPVPPNVVNKTIP